MNCCSYGSRGDPRREQSISSTKSMSSCLLPHFKCMPDAFSSLLILRTLPNKNGETTHIRTQCALYAASASTSSTATAVVLDLDRLRLPSLDAQTGSISASRLWTYTGSVRPPPQMNLEATLASENLLTSDEVVVAAAAAEAVTFAKAALKSAKDAALLIKRKESSENEHKPEASFKMNNSLLKHSENKELRKYLLKTELIGSERALLEEDILQSNGRESNDLEPTDEECKALQEQFSKCVIVRSQRQMERKVRRERTAEKAAANVVSIKSGSLSKKKRVSSHDADYPDLLRYLKGSSGSSRLLTSTEELELSEGIQGLLKMERLHEELVERCGCDPTIAQWAAAAGTDQKTLRKRINYGIICKDKMIKSNIRLVISIARNYQNSGMNLQDLVQEGCRGLMKGTEKFDASKGFKFSTYAHWWIKQAVRKYLSDKSRTIRLPFHMVEAIYKVKEARKQLYSVNGRQPENEEVAEAAGLSLKRLNAVLMVPKAPRSLDQKIGINQNLKPSEVISDPGAETAEDLLLREFMKKDLEKVLDSLNPREKQVVRWRFGLKDGRMKTLQEIGEIMGVSRERIRQIESCAFRKLKNKKRTKHLQQYITL